MDLAVLLAVRDRLQATHPGATLRVEEDRDGPLMHVHAEEDVDVIVEGARHFPSARVHVDRFTFETIAQEDLERFLSAVLSGATEERRLRGLLGTRLFSRRLLVVRAGDEEWLSDAA